MATTEELQLNNQEALVDDVESSEDKEGNFFNKAKKLFTNKEVIKQVGKTAVGSIASIAGIKSFYDVPAYFKQKFEVVKDKNEYNEIFSNLGNEEVDESETEDKKVAEIVDLGQVEVMQDKIESMDVSEEIKDKLTQELNGLVENYHAEMETLKTGENEKLTSTLDEYVKTKISGAQTSKEALNTLFVASGAYGLRGLSYGALSVYERQQNLQQEADKEGKEVDFMKDVVIEGARETFKNIAFKGEGTKMRKTLNAIKSFGSLARFAGIAETSISAPENYDKAIDKLLDTLDGETDWNEAGRNFVQNIENKTPFVGGVAEAEAGEYDVTEGMTEKQLKEFNTFKKWAEELNAEGEFSDEELAKMRIYGGREDKAHELFTKKAKLRLLNKFAKETALQGEMESWTDEEGLEHVRATNKGVAYEYTTDEDGNTIKEELSGKKVRARWDYKSKSYIGPDISGEDLAEKRAEWDDKKEELEEAEAPDSSENNLESSIFSVKGKEQFMEAMKNLAGEDAEEAYKQNFAVIQAEINAYLNSSISKEELIRWSKGINEQFKSKGAESDIIDIDKLLKLKPKVIKGSGADFDAF